MGVIRIDDPVGGGAGIAGDGVDVTSAPVACFGAEQVVFHEVASGSQLLGATSIEVSMDKASWVVAAGGTSLVSVAPATLGLGPYTGAGVMTILYPTTAGTKIPWKWCRKKWSGIGATPTNDVVGFKCVTRTIIDANISSYVDQP